MYYTGIGFIGQISPRPGLALQYTLKYPQGLLGFVAYLQHDNSTLSRMIPLANLLQDLADIVR